MADNYKVKNISLTLPHSNAPPAAESHTAVLWTGGKDSALALHIALQQTHVISLVTFTPAEPQPFYAHSLKLIALQAERAGIPHQTISIGEPYELGYEAAFKKLAAQGIETIVSGDIDFIGGFPNWIRERAGNICNVWLPLWQRSRESILNELVDSNFEVVITLAYKEHFGSEIIAKPLNRQLIDRFKSFHKQTGFDICGENGEYHSMVLNAPYFKQSIELESAKVLLKNNFYYLSI